MNPDFQMLYKIEPVAKQRARITMRGAYTPKKTKDFEHWIKTVTSGVYKKEPMTEALFVELRFFLKRPKSVKREYPIVKPDVDNFVKSMFDGLNGVLWNDDAQVVKVQASKEYSSDEGFIVLKVHKLHV
jgi:Holliday junction resolvase RusA-like endonuclease